MSKYLIEKAKDIAVEIPELFLMDVGASGGINEKWRLWGEKLSGAGFDPITSEVEKLNKSEVSNFTYHNFFVSRKESQKKEVSSKSNYQIRRTAAWMACKILEEQQEQRFPFLKKNYDESAVKKVLKEIPESPAQSTFASDDTAKNDPFLTYYQKRFASNQDQAVTEKFITLDEFSKLNSVARCDFIKIDTDGHELAVLEGALDTIRNKNVLGIEIECQFHGPNEGFDGCFSDIDQLLRKEGFSLFKLDPVYYSRCALPSKFLYKDLPAQNVSGQIQWADALYLRDLADPKYGEKFNFKIDERALLNLAFIFDLYELCDCSAEIIINNISTKQNRELLDFLCEKFTGKKDYFLHMKNWLSNPLKD
jgi:FkbM family methyltransferase